jgi:arylsulfatase A-like enzyme
LTFALLLPWCTRSSTAAPNIVIILADDQGWGDLGVHGNSNLATPHIDSLAREGALFERFFVCPVCSPTRAEFLTGRYHPRGGVHSTSTGGERLDLDERTIAEAFKAAGYATGAFGKWHNGMQYPYHPNARGFEEFYGFCSGHWGHYFSPELEHNGQLVRGNGYITDDFTDHAIRFIEANRERPFFCYLPLNTPHSPMQVPDRFYARFEGAEPALRHRDPEKEDLAMTRAALAMCENIDWNVGRILAKLEELGLAENTIVLYFCDNGPNSWRWNGEMRGRKGSTDEGGVRSPLLVRWPARIGAGRKISQIAGAIDLLPTLAELAEVPVLGDKPLDGVSLAPVLTGDADAIEGRMIYSHWAGRVSVRTDQYRLDDMGRLYDMAADPGQRHDVSAERPEIASRLAAAVADWKAQMLPQLERDERPFPVGYTQFPVTHLPARDGVPHGNVKRSAAAPNCSYFTNWTSTEDQMTWDIEVATSGQYEAVVHYTCAARDVGARIELRFGERSLETKIAEAHDGPLVGAEQDRAPRGSESYVKDFKPLRLGTFALEEGRGELSLRALDVPGKQVADVRYVVLTRIQ